MTADDLREADSPAFFESALALLGVPAERVAMVGDDIVNDVLGAQACGLTGVLVRTGKFMAADLEKGDARPRGRARSPICRDCSRRERVETERTRTPGVCSRASRPSTSGWARSWRSGRTRGGGGSWCRRSTPIPGAWVLDVASGTGLVARELAARRTCASSRSIQSEPMLRAGPRRCASAGLEDRIRSDARTGGAAAVRRRGRSTR